MRHDPRVRPARPQLIRVIDTAIPWGVGAFLVLVALEESSGAERWALIVLAIIQGGALRWRGSHPELVTAVVLAGGLGYQLLLPEVVLPIAGFFAVGSLAAARPPRVSLFGLAGLIGLAASNFVTATVEDTLFTIGLAVGAWALGEAARNRRIAIREEARRAVSEEQARISRELHDVIAHSVSVIVVQAGAADHVFDERPDQARAALRTIESAARDAQRELNRLLSAVRTETDGDVPFPQPGLDQIDALVEPLRASGLLVRVRREGATRELPAGVELSAYRIVQEALTNILRHARATRADVTVRSQPEFLDVEVVDDGRGHSERRGDGGFGILGMRERTALVGGTLETGPLPGGGYRVHARLPLEPTG